jgi:hypothetical protein
MAAIITIPQRFQVVNGTTAVEAGTRMLPLLLCSPIATIFASVLLSKLKLPPLYVLLAGCGLQALGVGLFSSLDSSRLDVPSFQYGYQVLMGCGFGLNLSTVLMMVPLVVKQRDMGEAGPLMFSFDDELTKYLKRSQWALQRKSEYSVGPSDLRYAQQF